MKSIAIASLFVLGRHRCCTGRNHVYRAGGWETGAKIILVDPSYVRGQPMTSHRNGNSQRVRSFGVAEETTPCRSSSAGSWAVREFSAARLFGAALRCSSRSKALPRNPPDWSARPHGLITVPTC